MLDGLRILSEVLVDVSEIPEEEALLALISNFSSDVYGLLVVLEGLLIVSKVLID